MNFCQHVLLAGTLLLAAVPARAETVDLELVLAVDASGSVDPAELALQLGGIAAALRDEAVRAAIRAGPNGRIAVNLITWAEPREPKSETGWHVLSADAGIDAFAARVAAFPRDQNGATGLGEGIAAGVRALTRNIHDGTRMVIDVSGDGRETAAREYVLQLADARIMASSSGVTVNGLAILNEDKDLATYYRDAMITGPGSFVMAVDDFSGFAAAMREKLLREIENRPNVAMR